MGFQLSLFLGLCALLTAQAQQAPTFKAEDIYRGCGRPSTRCYGDVDGCIQNQNCTFALALTENSTHFAAEIQNNCNADKSKNVFLGIGVHALKKDKNNITQYTCTPKFEDFKFVILWENEKCPEHGAIQKKWGTIEKRIPLCTSSSDVDDLPTFLDQSMLVKSGNIPTDLIGNKGYVTKDDGDFFINSGILSRSASALVLLFLCLLHKIF